MKILGVHIGHDSSAALVIDGEIVADVAEERFTRTKHYAGLPIHSIAYCLESQGLSMTDIDFVAVPTSGSVEDLNFLFDLTVQQQEAKSKQRRLAELLSRIRRISLAVPPIYMRSFPVSKSMRIVHVEHHLAHAASAYYTSGTREKQLVVTMDGVGDGYSTCVWRAEEGKIIPLKKMNVSASLGGFYSNVTEALGWWHGDGEGKTMGLAPYGDYNKVKGVLDKYYPKFNGGDIVEPHDFGQPYFWNENGAFQYHYDEAYDIRELINKHGREHIAAEAQRVLEEQTAEIIYPWLEKENTRNLSCSGGIFLNVKLNQRIWESGKVSKQHIFPNAGDSGLAVGAALQVYYDMNPTAPIRSLSNLFLGPEYSAKEIEAILKLRSLSYRFIENIPAFAAKLLAENKIVAWFQGRMESGPRALGNRSILMSANKAENKDIINARVKFREAFRPFCPSLLWEKKNDYMEKARDENFMITSFTCKEGKRNKIPAVVHADATLRPQTIKKEDNEKYWNLINEFGKLTGEYVLLNSSFNVMGEPIVNHPRQAIRCFYDCGLDYLVMGNFVLSKESATL
ncbi:MAG: carbamoyltransferase [Candidatus Saganbacteria bacterium]|uniref:Carbamoyltransferase n=1 Tax=Candidatus Saganbacteria bacterium TaxID=2575572 RepID=A0A833L2B6_UNCSA|nr:MAG: carbamoyltransferase [Candidatus Saganbacteria bacterium]